MLQSTIKIKDLVDMTSDMNMKAVAITDLGNMMGAFRFVDAVKKKNKQIKDFNENNDKKFFKSLPFLIIRILNDVIVI